jgi:hypothetical protein
MLDPFGVLNYLAHSKDRDDVYSLLIANAASYSCDDIRTSPHLNPTHKVRDA